MRLLGQSNQIKMFAIVMFSQALIACGGSSSSDDSGAAALSVNAGSDIQLDEKLTFTVSATASPEGGTFTWRQQSGTLIEGFPLEGAEQQITAPDIKRDEDIVLAVEYVAPDNRTVSDSLTISVKSVNLLPVVSIKQTAPSNLPSIFGDTVTLSSNESFDPDENGTLVSYLWQQVSGPSINITPIDGPDLSFVHPLYEENQEVRFSLTITDDEGGVQSNSLALLLQKSSQLVFANAGANQTGVEFSTVILDATSSQTVSGQFSCSWQQVSGVTVQLDNANLCKTQFIVPDIDAQEALIFNVTVQDLNNRTDTAQTRITAMPKPLGLINDTGLTVCYGNDTTLTDCASSEFPTQDAAVGRDSHAGLLDKVGSGPQAFDFTKLDQFAGELPDDATDFSCVRDNVSGLIWEVKQLNNGALPNTLLRENINSYSWYISGIENGSFNGVEADPLTSCPSAENCGLEQFIDEVNASDYCGGNNWRVPTHAELSSLLHFGQEGSGSVLISEFFPNSSTQLISDVIPYWTVQTSAEGGQSQFAWAIDMITGKDIGYPKANLAYVRLVRSTGDRVE